MRGLETCYSVVTNAYGKGIKARTRVFYIIVHRLLVYALYHTPRGVGLLYLLLPWPCKCPFGGSMVCFRQRWQHELYCAKVLLFVCLYFIECSDPGIKVCSKCRKGREPPKKKKRLSLALNDVGNCSGPGRFQLVTKEVEEDLQNGYISENTQRATQWALKVFRDWQTYCKSRHSGRSLRWRCTLTRTTSLPWRPLATIFM